MKHLMTILGLLFLPLMLGADEFDYETLTARLFYFKGEVSLKTPENGQYQSVEKGELISAGDSLKTGKKSLAIVSLPDGSKLKVGASTEITLENLVERIQGESLGKTSIIMKAGRVLIDVINKGKEPVLEIKTKNVALGVRGTRFFAGFEENDQGQSDLWTAVEKGEIEVSNRGDGNLADAVEAGQGMVIESGQTFTQPKEYNWVKDMNYDATSKEASVGQFQKIRQRRLREFQKRRQAWQRNQDRWAKKQEIWKRFRGEYHKKLEKFKEIRKRFQKRRQQFMQERNKLLLERNQLVGQVKALRERGRELVQKRRQLMGQMKQAKGPREKRQIRQQLGQLKAEGQKLRTARDRIKTARGNLVKKRNKLIQFKKKEAREIRQLKKAQQGQMKQMKRQMKKALEDQKRKGLRRRRRPISPPPPPPINDGSSGGD